MFKYTPKSDAELSSAKLIPDGIYNFEVMSAVHHISKTGNESIKLYLKIWDNDGKERFIYDYLSDSVSFHFKLKHFCMGTGLKGKYDANTFNENDCQCMTGKLKIGKYKDRNDNGTEKNTVLDYLYTNEANENYAGTVPKFSMKPNMNGSHTDLNDPIPF
jgi:hypothetical protein